MAKFQDAFQRLDIYLVADVANAGTVTTPYPAGTTQSDFDTGLANPAGSYVMVNDTDKWNVADGKASFAFGGSITVTNSSGVTWKAGSKISLQLDQRDGNGFSLIQLPLLLASVAANGAVYNPGLRAGIVGTLEYFEAVVIAPVTTAAKLASLNLTIDGTDVTGGVLALTSAGTTPAGLVLPAPLITGANVLKAASKIGVKASGVTAFVEGQILLSIRIRHAMSQAY